jgi:hypothetical protein
MAKRMKAGGFRNAVPGTEATIEAETRQLVIRR